MLVAVAMLILVPPLTETCDMGGEMSRIHVTSQILANSSLMVQPSDIDLLETLVSTWKHEPCDLRPKETDGQCIMWPPLDNLPSELEKAIEADKSKTLEDLAVISKRCRLSPVILETFLLMILNEDHTLRKHLETVIKKACAQLTNASGPLVLHRTCDVDPKEEFCAVAGFGLQFLQLDVCCGGAWNNQSCSVRAQVDASGDALRCGGHRTGRLPASLQIVIGVMIGLSAYYLTVVA